MAEEKDSETTFHPQIHQKVICMPSNFHKTTSKRWRRKPGTQKGSLFSLKRGRTKYKRQKELGTETCPGEGVVQEEKFHTVGNPLTGRSVGSFGISDGNITRRKHTRAHTHTHTHTHRICTYRSCQWRSSPHTRIHYQQV